MENETNKGRRELEILKKWGENDYAFPWTSVIDDRIGWTRGAAGRADLRSNAGRNPPLDGSWSLLIPVTFNGRYETRISDWRWLTMIDDDDRQSRRGRSIGRSSRRDPNCLSPSLRALIVHGRYTSVKCSLDQKKRAITFKALFES